MPILSKASGIAAIISAGIASAALASGQAPLSVAPQEASSATRTVLEKAAQNLPVEDGRDFEFAQRGFIASWPEAVIRQENGRPSFDLAGNDFIEGKAPETVHPSLWRQNRVLRSEGLFRLAAGVYQV